MTSQEIDPTKPVQTKAGLPVKLFNERWEGSPYPLIGEIRFPSGNVTLSAWTLRGVNKDRLMSGERNDLMNVPPKKRAVYVNFTSRGLFDGAYADRYGADHFASHDRAACIRVEYAEGQYDD